MKSAHGILNIGPFSFRRPRHASRMKKVVLGLELLVGALLIAVICSISPQGAQTGSAETQIAETDQAHDLATSPEIADVPDQVALHEECEHIWVPITRTVEHPATSHQVSHDAVYETTTSLHTVCNDCHKVIDGRAQAHIEKTGHGGFTTSVPIDERILVEKAWTETVTDEAAWTESVTDGYICSLCNAKTGALA